MKLCNKVMSIIFWAVYPTKTHSSLEAYIFPNISSHLHLNGHKDQFRLLLFLLSYFKNVFVYHTKRTVLYCIVYCLYFMFSLPVVMLSWFLYRGDHTWVDSNLAVLPPKTESVVFSIDGSFTASVSIRGKDPKVRAGAVYVVR